MKNHSNIRNGKSGFSISDLIITKEEKMLDQLQPVSSEISEMESEGGESFISYIRSIGLAGEENLMVLPSSHHYYYEKNEMAGISTLVNMRSLNTIANLESFLNTLMSVLPPSTNFIGCFSDNAVGSNGHKNKKSSVLYQRLINLLDSRKVHFMTKNEVFSILEKYGFRIVDMTDIGGLTYFYSQNAPGEAEFRASIETPVKYN
ncbi:MAG: hypothetical protein GYA41_12425 [Bacteroidales bacterium]|nr:hypothetical protein [Bacteroidales bacterium]